MSTQPPSTTPSPIIPSPIQYEQYSKELNGIFSQDNFDGFRIEAAKNIGTNSSNFQTAHSLFLGTTMRDSGYLYQFGPNWSSTSGNTFLMGRYTFGEGGGELIPSWTWSHPAPFTFIVFIIKQRCFIFWGHGVPNPIFGTHTQIQLQSRLSGFPYKTNALLIVLYLFICFYFYSVQIPPLYSYAWDRQGQQGQQGY